MRHFGLIAILTLSLISCSNKKNQTENAQSDNSYTEVFEFPIKKFSLPYDITYKSDSNSLIYLKQVPFDTSYLLHIVKQGLQIRGVCYIVLPTFHRDLDDSYGEKNQLIFFDGMSFVLDSTQWTQIKRRTDHLILELQGSNNGVSSPCFDCPSYSVIFGKGRENSTNSKQRDSFREYDLFVKESLLYCFYFLRKHGNGID